MNPGSTPEQARRSATAYVGLGANLGEAAATIRQAATELAGTAGVADLLLSSLYASTPIDSSGPDYVNAVARLRTTLSPEALLDALQAIEHRHGRLRPYRNAPRTLDLDLLLYEDRQIATARLTVPHPRMHERAFVLRPLQDLAPTLTLAQGPLATLLARCAGQGIRRLEDTAR
ncbi:MAG TPA: 2-amino-4-hydroxy-6-hydroxymethyldihydropteridine diphosphokinase [Castellaniella sp.]|jgi:2-amino-4-hydroxy-6-hydroxymethyldihydropteridine diphosphokinase|nr:2-amino-4-hydroxy-6-hydroxymethyldihydropteridine diphosphokinase [Castellaniella sp.]